MTPPRPDTGPIEGRGFRRDFATLKTLSHYLWPAGRLDLKSRVVLAIALLVSAKLANVMVPILLKDIFDSLDSTQTLAVAIPVALIAGYGLARLMAAAFGELRDAAFAKVGQHAVRSAALSTFRHLHRLSLKFHLDRQTGGLSRIIERGTKGIEFLLTFMLFNVLPTLLEIGLVCAILLDRYAPSFALVTLVSVVAYIAFTMIVTEWRIKFRREMNRTDERAHTRAIDSLLNYETVKYFNNEDHEARRFDRSLERYEVAAVRSKVTLSFLNIGQGFIIGLGVVAIMLLAADGVVSGELTLGDLVLVNAFMLQLYQPLNFLGFVYREIKQSLVDMERMFDLLKVNADVTDEPEAPALAVPEGEIRFENVTFSYRPDRTILNDISFTVPAGKTVAIVGPSGAGKSTIARLLYRFYDVNEGAILIDGQDIRSVQQSSVRQAIGIVPQDTVLFNDTVLYNIDYAAPGADEAHIHDAARSAKIHDFIESLPDRYQTTVGERGLKLSGGEKQRVAIARVILKAPPILIFDEATSALDTHTEKDIQASLKEVSKGQSTLVIAHRLSTIVDADQIIVLSDGQIAERGTHAELLDAQGLYAKMWARQQENEEAAKKLEAFKDDEAVLS